MTTLFSYNRVLPHNFILKPRSIVNNTANMSKLSSTSSISSNRRGLKSYSVLSRSDSFSSCSNDSSVYSGSNPIQTRYTRNAKHTIVNQPTNARKRTRNSSGSSLSSNISGVSDRDSKTARIISQNLNNTEGKNCINKSAENPQLNHSKVDSIHANAIEETVLKEDINCAKNSVVILPNRHNLRGKITKKGCTCCPSSCATVVFREYKKFIKTDEKTVIASTKVKTIIRNTPLPNISQAKEKNKTSIVQSSENSKVSPIISQANKESKNSTISQSNEKNKILSNTPQASESKISPNIPQNNERSMPSNISETDEESKILSNNLKARKRRSEIEKLYASLHEIEWAKDFSPDNILRPINIRQAASCSVFGRPLSHTDHSPDKKSKKKKDGNDSSLIKSTSKISPQPEDSNSKVTSSNVNKRTCTMANCDNEQEITNLQTTEITTSDLYHCNQNYNSHSSVNITSCSVSHINMKEMNINSHESICTESIVTENDIEYIDDAQLSYTSDESSSAVPSSIVNLQSKHLLDFKYNKNKNNQTLSDADLSEYSTPTFFDIAEEGIRTIDACFREVGAEVVVSTCYDEESSLPLLTSIRENKTTSKSLGDNPPVLEPCITVEFNHNIKEAFIGNQLNIRKKSEVEECSKLPLINSKNERHESQQHASNSCDCQNNLGFRGFKKCHPFSKLHHKTARKVVKKYCNLSQHKLKPKSKGTLKIKSSVGNRTVEIPNKSDRQCKNKDEHFNVKGNEYLVHDSVSSSSSTSSSVQEIFSSPENKKLNKCVVQRVSKEIYSKNKNLDKMILDSNRNGSCLFDSRKVVKYTRGIKKISVLSQAESSTSQTRSIASTYNSTQVETTDEIYEEHISRPTPSFGFSSEYKSIKVNRSYNYTHIILLVNRGKSMFLTLETLRELKDVFNRTNNDSSCQVLVINGVGDSFCLGLDLKPLVGPRKKTASTETAIAIKELIEALSNFRKPLAAVVNGPALGLGMTLLNHADLTIASDKATFCMPYSFLGYMPEGGATLTLPQVVGSTVAMDLILKGRTITAREACNIGLISEVLEAKSLPYELVSRVKTLAENSICALETTKALLKMQLHANLPLVLENEVKLLPRMWLTRTCQNSLRKALHSGILSE